MKIKIRTKIKIKNHLIIYIDFIKYLLKKMDLTGIKDTDKLILDKLNENCWRS